MDGFKTAGPLFYIGSTSESDFKQIMSGYVLRFYENITTLFCFWMWETGCKTTDYIKRIFEKSVKNWDGGTKIQSIAIGSMLDNKKYKGDTLLQKVTQWTS